MSAYRALDAAASAVGQSPRYFDASAADDELLAALRATGVGVEFLALTLPWVPAPRT